MPAASTGLIGIGLLGSALARRLRSAGFPLCGYDPDPAAAGRLSSAGGEPVSTPEEVARRCARILFSLPGPPQVSETVGRIEPHLAPGAIILDTTTGDPEAVAETAARLAARGVAYLDCEVGGSSRQAAAGEAILICGGGEEAFRRARDVLDALSGRVFHTGPAGSGTRMKLALNICIGLHRAVLAESLEFAGACGIRPAAALEILKSGPAYSKAMDVKGRKMIERDFAPEARLAQHLKDVRLIRSAGRRSGARLPLTALHETLLEEAVELGLGERDNSAIVEVFARRREAGNIA